MAKICDLKDDLTGELGSVGSRGAGGRSQADQYMQAIGNGGGKGVATPAHPPAQFAMAPQRPNQSAMPPPMDASASMQQAMQRAAMESEIMRPPYSQPYGPAAYATQPGFQGAPVGAMQAPIYSSLDACGSYGAAPRMTPAMQMQALQQQRMSQLQAQQQALSAQAMSAKAGQACLKGKKGKQLKNLMAGVGEGGAGGKPMWKSLLWFLLVLLIVGLLIGILVKVVQNSKQNRIVASTLQMPIIA